MKIALENFKENILSFMRSCGYTVLDRSADDEWNFARSLAGKDYPRFHCYVKQEGGKARLNLHLDQKRPSYAGAARHSGEYEGEVVAAEAERILSIFKTATQTR